MFFNQKKEARGEEALNQGFKLGEGHSRSTGSDPAVGEVSPKQGSGGKVCQKTEPSQIQKETGVEAHSKLKATAPKFALGHDPGVILASPSDNTGRSPLSQKYPAMISQDQPATLAVG